MFPRITIDHSDTISEGSSESFNEEFFLLIVFLLIGFKESLHEYGRDEIDCNLLSYICDGDIELRSDFFDKSHSISSFLLRFQSSLELCVFKCLEGIVEDLEVMLLKLFFVEINDLFGLNHEGIVNEG